MPSRPPDRARASHATVVAWLALFVALGGVASGLPGRESVNSGDVVDDSLRSRDIRNHAIHHLDLGRHLVRGGNIANHVIGRSQLAVGGVRTASLADGAVTPAKLASVPAVKVTTPKESPGCATQEIASNATETVQWSEEVYDTANMHQAPPSDCSAAGQSRLTAPIDGIYLVSAGVVWDSNGTGTRQISILKDQTQAVATDSRSATTGGGTGQTVAVGVDLSAGDYVELRATQDAGTALQLPDFTETFFALTWIAPAP